ncbi:Major facilitator superfamily domain, general substrate transporter [Metarhizium rileyi]|uniref:Major facilitator superfamily domain, general substrate transporter n=1 Tax=Metarhizium rileyi (strain RCEF 4871) TaxID=1649241 RepID=A0A162JGI0_METRR|nr:Major facilitator superfamily domain, general substrate transporter [Metarhizium rileyi RCEF 4871]
MLVGQLSPDGVQAVIDQPDAAISSSAPNDRSEQHDDAGKPPDSDPCPVDSPLVIPSPPNGGSWAWIQVAAGFSIFFNTWGVLNAFGIFQTYYEGGHLFRASSSNISWIGSIQAYCVLVVGLVSGPIYDRGHLRVLVLVGSSLLVLGFMMLSVSKTFWQALLSQGFCIGIGAGFLFVPSLALLPTYFSTRIGLAVGIAASGSSLGGVIYPIVFYKLIDRIGFGWTVRTIGFIVLVTQIIPLCFAQMRAKPTRARDVLDWSAFTDWPFVFFVVSTLVGFIGLYVVLFYISYFGVATGIVSSEISFYLVPILNAASMFGRTLPNAVSDKTGPFNLFGPAAVICGLLTFCLLAVNSLGGITTIAVLYGFFSGVFIAIPGVCFVKLTEDKSKLGTRIGMGFAAFGFGVLAGGPGGGVILGTHRADLHWDSILDVERQVCVENIGGALCLMGWEDVASSRQQ